MPDTNATELPNSKVRVDHVQYDEQGVATNNVVRFWFGSRKEADAYLSDLGEDRVFDATVQSKGFPSPAQLEKMPKCTECGHTDPEHGFNGPCEADWGKCPCKRFNEPVPGNFEQTLCPGEDQRDCGKPTQQARGLTSEAYSRLLLLFGEVAQHKRIPRMDEIEGALNGD